MGRARWGAVRRGGWLLIAVGVVGLSMWVVTRALGAATDDDFDRWVGWANILALPLGGLGTVLVVVDRVNRRPSLAPAAAAVAGHQRPETPAVQVQHVQASGGTAQGVMNGTIINHQAPQTSEPPGGPSGR